MLLKIINAFKYDYNVIIDNIIQPIIINDINYILDNYNKISYDIWEENLGWHFYTRMVQLKFLKDSSKELKILNIDENTSSKINMAIDHLINDQLTQ